jgi:hypothetical protein
LEDFEEFVLKVVQGEPDWDAPIEILALAYLDQHLGRG